MLETAVMPGMIRTEGKRRTLGATFRVLWLGQLIPRKAPVLAVLAVAKALEGEAGFVLAIAGGGPEEARLREEVRRLGIEEHVEFLGRVPKDGVNHLMDEADAFLFTSIRDTSGNVVLEAMSRGLPVVALWHQGVREICDHDSAMLVEPSSVEESVTGLASALIRMKGDAGLVARLSVAGRERIARLHTWDRYRTRMLEIYGSAGRKSIRDSQNASQCAP
jgi:glycosyltransferase involved in cell wall biosynthesis